MFIVYTLIFTIISFIVLILDETSNVPAVNQTEINSTAPKFKDLNSVDRVMVGYERNTIKLKCEAEGNCQFYKLMRVVDVEIFQF